MGEFHSLDTGGIKLCSPDTSAIARKRLSVAVRRLLNLSKYVLCLVRRSDAEDTKKRTTVQPEETEQSLPPDSPVSSVPFAARQPLCVCSAIWLYVMRFTPSMMSISPFVGQLLPLVQILGHTCGHTQHRVSHEIDFAGAEDVRSSRMAGVRRR